MHIFNIHRSVDYHNKGLGIVACYLELWGYVRFVSAFIRLKPHANCVTMELLKNVQMQWVVGPSAGWLSLTVLCLHSQFRWRGFLEDMLKWLGPGIFADSCHITGS